MSATRLSGKAAAQLLSIGLALSAIGCSDLSPADDSYASKLGTGTGMLSDLPPNWACLAQPATTEVMPDAALLNFTGYAIDYQSQTPLQNVTMKACRANDPICETGIALGVPTGELFDGGPPTLTVQLPADFVGFLRLSAPTYVTYDYFVGGPMKKNVIASQPFTLVSQESFVQFARGLGADPMVAGTQGALAVQILDCLRDPAPEVELRLSDPNRASLQAAELWAAQGLIPVPDQETDNLGVAGFINLPSENVAVEAFVAGRTFGARSFRIEAGRLTTGTIRPDYSIGL